MFGQQPQYNGYNGYGQPQPMQQYGSPCRSHSSRG